MHYEIFDCNALDGISGAFPYWLWPNSYADIRLDYTNLDHDPIIIITLFLVPRPMLLPTTSRLRDMPRHLLQVH
jgi:hypothetical protein